ncbi:hypothetical protein VTI74DRAFT_4109 [Chaetomium olivicolor]
MPKTRSDGSAFVWRISCKSISDPSHHILYTTLSQSCSITHRPRLDGAQLRCDHAGQTVLHLAAAESIADAIPLLFERGGVDTQALNAGGYTPLYAAITQGQLDAAMALLGHALSSNPVAYTSATASEVAKTMSALHAAARFAFFPLVRTLLDCGADANLQDAQGRTALHLLLKNERLERMWDMLVTLAVLREAGADFELRSHWDSGSANGSNNKNMSNGFTGLVDRKDTRGNDMGKGKEIGGVTPNDQRDWQKTFCWRQREASPTGA